MLTGYVLTMLYKTVNQNFDCYHSKCVTMDTRLYGLETRALAMLRPFYGCLCTFFGISVSASSNLSHSLVEIQH